MRLSTDQAKAILRGGGVVNDVSHAQLVIGGPVERVEFSFRLRPSRCSLRDGRMQVLRWNGWDDINTVNLHRLALWKSAQYFEHPDYPLSQYAKEPTP